VSKSRKLTIGIGASFLILLAALIIFLRYLVTKSFPVTQGAIAVHGLRASADVYRDALGVPHIRAQNEHDMFFAVGYVHAQDRLWQMDVIRRTGQGRLSEIFGRATLDYDKLFRTVGIDHAAAQIEQHLHPETRRALEAYAEGVNAFITAHSGNLPVEFDILNYRPEPWELKHSVLVARMMGWELNLASLTDLTFGLIVARIGPDKASEIFPSWQRNESTIIPSRQQIERGPKENFQFDAAALDILTRVPFPMAFLTVNRNFREQTGSQGGSNCWVINSQKSMSGKPILANDVHLPLSVPSRWYQIHFSCVEKDSPWDVEGLSIPGAPVIVLGRNNTIAWGVTNAMVDDVDFWIERSDSSFAKYEFQGRNLPVEVREEKIYIGATDSISLTVRSTHHGPIVDEIPSAEGEVHDTNHRYALSMRWTGLEISDELQAFLLIDRARNAEEFEQGVKEITVPGLNILFADTAGDIGYWTAARIPVRGNNYPMLPFAGWTGENEWKGYVPFKELPKLWNPREGHIATANNKIAGNNFPYYISELWEPSSRIVRIHELLNAPARLAEVDFQRFQMDVGSQFGRDLVHQLLEAVQGITPVSNDMESVLEYLRNWDFRYNKNDVASTILNVAFVKVVENIFADELGDSVLGFFTSYSAIPYRVVGQFLTADSSSWFDDIRTSHVETKDEILRKSLYDAIEDLRTKLGPDTKTWRWGNLHTATFEHPFGKRQPLDKVFNIGPFPIGGSATTLNKSDFRIRRPYATTIGPSMRQVIDLANSRSMSSVINSGQSGQALHKHYDDQTVLWLTGSYHTITIDWHEITSSGWEHLTLKPW